MNSRPASPKRPSRDTAAVLARWLLGALFIYAGLNKALHPVEFLKLVRQYEMVDNFFLLNSIGALLPWFEVFCGLLLLAGTAVRGTALILLVMLIPFTIVIAHRTLNIHTALGIPFCAVKFDCGCGTGEVLICRKLAENCGLMLLAAWLLAGRGRRFCLRYQMLKGDTTLPDAKAK
jgi:uncharacterized membrane protein YphA (DoxX/SURF4 family)